MVALMVRARWRPSIGVGEGWEGGESGWVSESVVSLMEDVGSSSKMGGRASCWVDARGEGALSPGEFS